MTAVHPLLAGVWDLRGAAPTDPVRALAGEGQVHLVGSGPLRAGAAAPDLVRPGAPVLLDGHLTNLDRLAPGGQPWDVRLHALWLREGDDVLRQLRGAFVLLLWDAGRERAVVVRDPTGVRPVLLGQVGSRLEFATDIRPLLRLSAGPRGPDRLSVARWIAGADDAPGHTLWEGVRRLSPGTTLVLHASGVRETAWPRLQYSEPHQGGPGELAEELRRQLKGAVSRACGAPGTTGVMLSGGLDSTTVVACAADNGERLTGWSALFPDHAGLDESRYISDVVAHHSLAHHGLEVRGGSVLGGVLDYLRRWDAPSLGTSSFFKTTLLRRAAASGTQVMLDGEGGDELFRVRAYAMADELRAGHLGRAWQLVSAFPVIGPDASVQLRARLIVRYGAGGLLPARLVREAVPELARLRREHRTAVRGSREPQRWRTGPGPRHWESQRDLMLGSVDGRGLNEHFARLARAGGVLERHPLLDQELVTWVLGLPPNLSFSATRTRPLLREAMTGLLPDSVRLRIGKSRFDPLRVASLTGVDRPVVIDLLTRGPRLAAWVPDRLLRELAAGPPSRGAARGWSRTVLDLAVLEAWLRRLEDPAALDALLSRHPLPNLVPRWV